MLQLTCHRETQARSVRAVSVECRRTPNGLLLEYRIDDWTVVRIPPAEPIRTDGLWRTTCFELFVRSADAAAYREFNFAPSGAWAAYAFDDYRTGMTDLAIPPPYISFEAGLLRAELDASALPPPPWRVTLTAVIEETDGTRSYWALRHPPGPPDFHHPDGFALALSA